jgi:hypothetical protein
VSSIAVAWGLHDRNRRYEVRAGVGGIYMGVWLAQGARVAKRRVASDDRQRRVPVRLRREEDEEA